MELTVKDFINSFDPAELFDSYIRSQGAFFSLKEQLALSSAYIALTNFNREKIDTSVKDKWILEDAIGFPNDMQVFLGEGKVWIHFMLKSVKTGRKYPISPRYVKYTEDFSLCTVKVPKCIPEITSAMLLIMSFAVLEDRICDDYESSLDFISRKDKNMYKFREW